MRHSIIFGYGNTHNHLLMSNCTLSIAGLTGKTNTGYFLSDQLLSIEETCFNSTIPNDRSVFIDGHTFLLVTRGKACLQINGHDFNIEASDMAILAPIHLIRLRNARQDFRYQLLIADKYILNESHAMPYIQLYNHPITTISSEECTLLSGCMNRITECIHRKSHHMHRELVLNCLQYFLIELNNILITGHQFQLKPESDRQNSIFHEFLSLLLLHYREEHNTEFYATRLNMSIHNLGRIIKNVANVSPSDFIHEILFTEARRLLSETDISAQQIAMSLHFSDQSAFGKFFKRKSGISPSEYRRDRKL